MNEFPDIPGYVLHRELGRGGMATVYLATQKSLDRQVALKVMAMALAADRSFTERFLREARTVAQLQHPAIVPVHDMGVAGDLHFIAMEYVGGGDLKSRLRGAAMPPAQALTVLTQIAGALDYAHGKGFVHRDVKPENILFRDNGSAVLSDFGIARAMRGATRMTGTGMSLGTPHYMSPEQARGMEVDGRSDLYSLGVVFHEMLTGELPYSAQDSLAVIYRHVNDPVPILPRELAPWQGLLAGLMAKDPENRLQSGQEVVDAVDDGPGARRRTRSKVAVAGRTGSRRVRWLLAAVLVLMVGGLVIAIAMDWRPFMGPSANADASIVADVPDSAGNGTAGGEPGAGVGDPRPDERPPACQALHARNESIQAHLAGDELFQAIEGLSEASPAAEGARDCDEAQTYQSLVLVAGAHVVKERQDVERLQSAVSQALHKAQADLEQLQRLAQLARLSGDGAGAAEAAVAIDGSQSSITNMLQRKELVTQRSTRLHAAADTLAQLVDRHGAWARLDPDRAYQKVASHVGMEALKQPLSIFLAGDREVGAGSD